MMRGTRSLRSGLVTATPPTPLRRGGGGGARTCATRRSIRRVAREGVGFGVRVRRRRQASPPDCSSSPSTPVGLAGAGCSELVGSRAHVHGYRYGVALFGKAYAQEADAPPLGNGASEVLEGAFSTIARRGTGEFGIERQGGTGPVSSDVGWVLATEDAGEGVAHGGARTKPKECRPETMHDAGRSEKNKTSKREKQNLEARKTKPRSEKNKTSKREKQNLEAALLQAVAAHLPPDSQHTVGPDRRDVPEVGTHAEEYKGGGGGDACLAGNFRRRACKCGFARAKVVVEVRNGDSEHPAEEAEHGKEDGGPGPGRGVGQADDPELRISGRDAAVGGFDVVSPPYQAEDRVAIGGGAATKERGRLRRRGNRRCRTVAIPPWRKRRCVRTRRSRRRGGICPVATREIGG
eukprot:scaffold9927_cov118-Isochrysis_galbana.AAC.2